MVHHHQKYTTSLNNRSITQGRRSAGFTGPGWGAGETLCPSSGSGEKLGLFIRGHWVCAILDFEVHGGWGMGVGLELPLVARLVLPHTHDFARSRALSWVSLGRLKEEGGYKVVSHTSRAGRSFFS